MISLKMFLIGFVGSILMGLCIWGAVAVPIMIIKVLLSSIAIFFLVFIVVSVAKGIEDLDEELVWF